MSKKLASLIILSIIAQAIIILFVDPDWMIPALVGNLSIVDVSLLSATFMLGLTKCLRRPNAGGGNTRKIPIFLIFSSCVLFTFLGYAMWNGFQKKYFGFWGYFSATTFFFFVFFLFCSLNLREADVAKHLNWFYRYSIISGAVCIPFLILEKFFHIKLVDISFEYSGYSAHFLWIIGLLTSISNVIEAERKTKYSKAVLLMFIILFIVLFEKKIIVPAAVSVLAFLVLSSMTSRFRHKSSVVTLACVGIFAAIITILPFGLSPLPSSVKNYYQDVWETRFLHEDAGGDLSGGRVRIYGIAMEMIKQNPWLGYGIGIRIDSGTTFRPEVSIHNTYLYFFLATGIFGGVAFLLVMFSVMRRCLKATLSADRTIVKNRIIMFSYQCGFLSLCFFDMFSIMQTSYVLFSAFAGILFNFYLKGDRGHHAYSEQSRYLYSNIQQQGKCEGVPRPDSGKLSLQYFHSRPR